jgi:hypothetical protein
MDISKISIYAKTGCIYGFKKELFDSTTQTNIVPIALGSRYYWKKLDSDSVQTAYLELDVGANFIWTNMSNMSSIGNKTTDSVGLGLSFGGGYRHKDLDLGMKIAFYDLGINHIFNYFGLSFSLGYYLHEIF